MDININIVMVTSFMSRPLVWSRAQQQVPASAHLRRAPTTGGLAGRASGGLAELGPELRPASGGQQAASGKQARGHRMALCSPINPLTWLHLAHFLQPTGGHLSRELQLEPPLQAKPSSS